MNPFAASVSGTALGLFRLVRPLNVLLFAAGTLLGAFLSASTSMPGRSGAWWAALAATLIGAAANAINDVFDAGIDRINRPDRPIPMGVVSPAAARWTWALLSAAGVTIAASLSLAHVIIAVSSVALLFGYAAVGKRHPIFKNLAVSIVVATALPFGALAVGSWIPALPAAAFAFMTTLAREIVKDIEDRVGDSAAGARTLVTEWGAERTSGLAIGLVGLTAVAAPAPSIALGYPGLYLLLLVPTISVLLFVATRLALRPPDATGASGAMKWAMVLGLLALASAAS